MSFNYGDKVVIDFDLYNHFSSRQINKLKKEKYFIFQHYTDDYFFIPNELYLNEKCIIKTIKGKTYIVPKCSLSIFTEEQSQTEKFNSEDIVKIKNSIQDTIDSDLLNRLRKDPCLIFRFYTLKSDPTITPTSRECIIEDSCCRAYVVQAQSLICEEEISKMKENKKELQQAIKTIEDVIKEIDEVIGDYD